MTSLDTLFNRFKMYNTYINSLDVNTLSISDKQLLLTLFQDLCDEGNSQINNLHEDLSTILIQTNFSLLKFLIHPFF